MFWLHPRPVLQDISNCYPDQYFTHQAGGALTLGRSEWVQKLRGTVLNQFFKYRHLDEFDRIYWLMSRVMMRIPFFRQKLTMGLEALLIPYCPNGRLLDVGCGNGTYLGLMKSLGWDVAGVEIDAKAAASTKSRLGVFVHNGTLEDGPFDEGSFDVITMTHVIEHVLDPVQFLRLGARFLKPGGQILIVTPNGRSLGRQLFKRDWYALDPPRHISLFTPRSITICLDQTGVLSPLRVRTSTRIACKIARKWLLVRRTGQFRDEMDNEALAQRWQARLAGRLFQLCEELGNSVLCWGEEIECIAIRA
jgi:2-polyprenyl-3-methyl-5-hydroxy-6-metoxy-1,4-benzoquinol methylase